MDLLRQIEDLSSEASRAYARRATDSQVIVTRGRKRRRRTRANWAALLVTASVATVVGGVGVITGDGSAVVVNSDPAGSPSAVATSTAAASAFTVPRRRLGAKDAALEATLIEEAPCPTLDGLSTVTYVAGAEPSTMSILIATTLRSGSPAALELAASADPSPGLRTGAPTLRSTSRPNGDRVVLEGTPNANVDPQHAGYRESGLPCAYERWERSSAETDADLTVLWGDAALYWVAGMRARGAEQRPEADSTRPALRFTTNSDEGVVVVLGAPGDKSYVAVTAATGTVPTITELQTVLTP